MTRALQRQIDAVKVAGKQVNLLLEQSPDRIEAIVQAAEGYDYVVLGATREPRVRQRFTGGNTSMVIAERTDTPVLLLHPETSSIEFGLQQTVDYISGGYRAVDPESRQRLEEQGYIERAKASASAVLKSSISQPVILVIGILTVAAAIMMYAGGGNSMTWGRARCSTSAVCWPSPSWPCARRSRPKRQSRARNPPRSPIAMGGGSTPLGLPIAMGGAQPLGLPIAIGGG